MIEVMLGLSGRSWLERPKRLTYEYLRYASDLFSRLVRNQSSIGFCIVSLYTASPSVEQQQKHRRS